MIWNSTFTDKLSDFAGLFFFPFVLAALLSLPLAWLRVSPRRVGGFDLKHYRRLIDEAKPADHKTTASVEGLKRALLFDIRRQARMETIFFGGIVIVTTGFAVISLTSGLYGPIGQIDFYQFAGSVIGLAVALTLIWVGLRAVSMIFNLPYVWQLLIKIADQQEELLAELRSTRTPGTTRHT